jgi:hypothetical protein
MKVIANLEQLKTLSAGAIEFNNKIKLLFINSGDLSSFKCN